ncbi:UNVERIFIED_CONTAM: hypothetical protein HDU68_005458 [Siphonaria sp. JEL0065]|nr:hypothetical protein HDU68_005458 [Siphonaria sp. JEL0065]
MKFSILSILVLVSISASAVPLFGAKSDTNAFSKPSTSKSSADAYFSTSLVKGFISIGNTNTMEVALTGITPNSVIAIALTDTTDFTHVKISSTCEYHNSTPSSIFIVDVPVNQAGMADVDIVIPYKGTDVVSLLKGFGVIILQDRKSCPGGVIIAGAPIEVGMRLSGSGKAANANDISLQEFLDSKLGNQ